MWRAGMGDAGWAIKAVAGSSVGEKGKFVKSCSQWGE